MPKEIPIFVTLDGLARLKGRRSLKAANRLKIRDWVVAHATGRRAYVTDITAAVVFPMIQGPNSRALLQSLIQDADLTAVKRWTFTHGHMDGTRVMISRTGVTKELGFALFVPADEAAGVWNALVWRRAMPRSARLAASLVRQMRPSSPST